MAVGGTNGKSGVAVVIFAAVAFAAPAGARRAPSHPPAVRAVRAINSPVFTRLIVECTSEVSYRVTRSAGDPPRVFVDIEGARPIEGGVPAVAPEGGPVSLGRVVSTGSGARVLIETRADASVSVFALLDPFRLVIDVGEPRTGARAPLAAPTPARDSGGAARGSAGKPPVPARPKQALPAPRLKVVVDPGHGGDDPGAEGVGGVVEKDVVLAVARRLAALLRAGGDVEVVLTRDGDVSVPLEERTARANAEGADLFVSVHANASPDRRLSGAETYYLNNTHDQATLRLARMENGLAAATGRVVRGRDVALILSDLVQSYKVEESIELAEDVQSELVAAVRKEAPSFNDLGAKRGPFFVLVGAAMPSVLVEVSFLSHPAEGRRLAQKAYQEAIAQGLLRGLRRFIENTRRAGTL